MIRILKYNLMRDTVPYCAVARHVGLQAGEPHLWAEVDSAAPQHGAMAIAHWTGEEVKGRYLGTIVGTLVVHYYQVMP